MRRESPAGACYPLIKKGHPIGKPPSILEEAGNIPGNDRPMSGLGQKRRFDCQPITSGLPCSTDILRARRHVLKVPRSDKRLWA
jgi:hypothetical protein